MVGMSDLLSTRKAAAHIGRSYPWLSLLVRQGRGPTPAVRGRQGASSFFTVAELDRWSALYAKNDVIPPPTPVGPSRVDICAAAAELSGKATRTTDPVERAELFSMAHALLWAIGEVPSLVLVHGAAVTTK